MREWYWSTALKIQHNFLWITSLGDTSRRRTLLRCKLLRNNKVTVLEHLMQFSTCYLSVIKPAALKFSDIHDYHVEAEIF